MVATILQPKAKERNVTFMGKIKEKQTGEFILRFISNDGLIKRKRKEDFVGSKDPEDDELSLTK